MPGNSRPEPHPHFIGSDGHGSTEEIIRQSKIWKRGEQGRRVGDATPQTRNTEGWSRPTSQSEKSQAGDSYRTVGGEEERSEGSSQADRKEGRREKTGRPEILTVAANYEAYGESTAVDSRRPYRGLLLLG